MKHDRMTERARLTMRHAKEEAARLGSNHASTEHVLLGLIAETDSVAVLALRNLGVDLAILRKKTIARVQDSSSSQEKDATQLSPSAKRAIQFAHQEAQSLGVNFIGTEHLLLGIIRETEGIAAKVLLSQRVDFVKTRAEILRLMGMGEGPDPELKRSRERPPRRSREEESPDEDLELTDTFQKVMDRAEERAARSGPTSVSADHIFLGLIDDKDTVAVIALRNLGVNLADLRKNTLLLETAHPLEDEDPTELSRSGNRVKRFAMRQALSQDADYIGTEHLLLGVIHEGEGVAARLLLSQGIHFANAYAEVKRIVGIGRELCRFSEHGLQTIKRAKEEAAALGCTLTSPEHILLGLIAEQDTPAVTVLNILGVNLEVLRQQTISQIAKSPAEKEAEEGPGLSQKVMPILEFAHQEAQSLGVNFIGTEHLLLGIIRETEGIAARVLLSEGVDLTKARAEVLRLMEMEGGEKSQGPDA